MVVACPFWFDILWFYSMILLEIFWIESSELSSFVDAPSMGFHLCGILMTVRLSWESSLGAVQMSGVTAAPGEAPPVLSAHVEQWAAHPALPSPNKESKGAASSTGVLMWWNWEIWNRTLSNRKRGAWTLPEEVGDKEGRWEGQAGNSF